MAVFLLLYQLGRERHLARNQRAILRTNSLLNKYLGQIAQRYFVEKNKRSFFSASSVFSLVIFLLSGVFAAFGQPDRGFFLCLLALLFGFSGIIYLLKDVKKGRFWLAFFWAVCVFSFELSWLSTTHYHGLSILFVYLVVVLLFAFQFAALPITKNFSLFSGLVIASIWTLFEWSRLFILCGFPFSPVGLILTAHPLFMQTASIFGIYGLSFLVIFLSYLLAFFRVKSFAACLGVLALFGFCHLEFFGGKNIHKSFYSVALLQTGLSVEEKETMDQEIQWERIFSFLKEKMEEM